jgi:hypothetical protein
MTSTTAISTLTKPLIDPLIDPLVVVLIVVLVVSLLPDFPRFPEGNGALKTTDEGNFEKIQISFELIKI